MSRSSSTIQDGSLELLLDTICNTFGGIVFISMLVVVLLNMSGESASSQPPTDESALELQQLTAELEATQDRLRTMQQLTQQREETIQKLVSNEQRILARKIVEAEHLRTARVEETAGVINETADRQKSVNTIAQSLESQKNELADRKKELEELGRRLQDQAVAMQKEVASRSQDVTPPKLEVLSNHRSISLILKGGRLTTLVQISANGVETPNLDELLVTEEGGAEYVEARSGSGVEVALDKSTKDQIQSVLRQYHPDKHVLKIWIWPDSFAHYQIIQEVLVQSRLRSKPEPVRQDARLSFGNVAGPVLGQ